MVNAPGTGTSEQLLVSLSVSLLLVTFVYGCEHDLAGTAGGSRPDRWITKGVLFSSMLYTNLHRPGGIGMVQEAPSL